MGLDPPRQSDRHHTALLDLAPHAGRDLQLLRKLGSEAERLRPIGCMLRHKVAEEEEYVASTDGWE